MNRTLILLAVISFIFRPGAFGQQTNESHFLSYKYLLYVPKTKPESGKFPLMLFLHGSGERGNDLKLVKKNGPLSFLDDTSDFPFVVVSPQCTECEFWSPQSLLTLLNHIEKQLPIDKESEYITGLSMGGYGTWDLANATPNRFAAIAPVCGGGDSTTIGALRNLPAWVFHGAMDDVVKISEAEVLVAKLKNLGAEIKFTVYPELGHDSWTPTYKNPELYKWLLAHKRKS